MKRLLTLLLLSTFFIACNSNTTPKKNIIKGPTPPMSVEKIDIPFRDFGYTYFSSTLIDSQTSLDEFLLKTMAKDNWRGKTLFLKKLQKHTINFEAYNLLFYKITEGSGSIKLTPKAPKTKTTTEHHVTVMIDRVSPKYHTYDMAYYGLAYKIGKNIADITFDNGKQKVVIENKASSMIVPKNCKAWFDGCNDCAVIEDGMKACDLRACYVDKPEDFRCTEWE
jgi:hypothetical protein